MSGSTVRPFLNIKSVTSLLYLGVVGFSLFILLRPSIDFYAGGPIQISQKQIESHSRNLLLFWEIDSDSVVLMSNIVQRHQFYKKLVDSLGRSSTINPKILNSSGVPLTGWKVTAASRFEELIPIQNENSIFNNTGIFQIEYDDQFRIKSLRTADQQVPFVSTDLNNGGMANIFNEFLGYDPSTYQIEKPPFSGEVLLLDDVIDSGIPSDRQKTKWYKTSAANSGPNWIELEYKPVIREVQEEDGITLDEGLKIYSVTTSYHAFDGPVTSSGNFTVETLIFIISLIIIIFAVIITGFRQIYLGEIIWHRGLVVFVVLLFTLLGWRVLVFQQSYYRFFETSYQWLDVFSGFLFYLTLSIYGSLAYMGWESLSRRNNSEDTALIDSVWTGKLFKKKLGESILSGYGFAGMTLALFSVILYYQQSIFYHIDGRYGFIQLSSVFPALSMTMGAFTDSWLIVFGHFGVILAILNRVVRNSLLFMAVAVPVIGFLLLLVGRPFGTPESLTQDFVLMMGISIPFILANRYYGIIASLTGYWVFILTIRLGVFFGSSDIDIAFTGWVLMSVVITPLILGFILYFFGDKLGKSRLAEYEERSLKQFRIEKEFQIAKDSQYALMPKSAPELSGVDIKGFFIPSFEVGGDFFDYQITESAGYQELVVSIVDVSGKAMKAAFSAIFTSGLLTSRISSPDPAKVLTDINKIVRLKTDKKTFITCLLARYQPYNKQMVFANAGHCKPILKRFEEVNYILSADPRYPLGAFDDVIYKDNVVEIKPGDVILFYSDGLPEAKNSKGEQFGFDEVKRMIRNLDTKNKTADEICDFIKQTILTFSEYELADDMTVVVVKMND